MKALVSHPSPSGRLADDRRMPITLHRVSTPVVCITRNSYLNGTAQRPDARLLSSKSAKVFDVAKKLIGRWDLLNKYIRTSDLNGTHKFTRGSNGSLV